MNPPVADFLLRQATELREQGHSDAEIRRMLGDSGVTPEAVAAVMRRLRGGPAADRSPLRPHRIGLATACLHISAVLYAVVGVGFFLLFRHLEENAGEGVIIGALMLAFSLALIVGIEVVAYGLRRRRFWAWIAGLCVFAVYAPSAFFPLGVLGLWALLDAGTRREFGQ